MVRRWFSAALITFLTAAAALAADAPADIKLGTLYASSGRFASISMPVHYGLKLWIEAEKRRGRRLREGIRQENPAQAGRL